MCVRKTDFEPWSMKYGQSLNSFNKNENATVENNCAD